MISISKENFFKYHANSGGKILSCYLHGKLEHISYADFMKIPPQVIELPSGGRYSIRKDVVVSI